MVGGGLVTESLGNRDPVRKVRRSDPTTQPIGLVPQTVNGTGRALYVSVV